MSLLAMTLGLRFCTSRKGGTGGGGRFLTLGPGNMATSGLSDRKPLVRRAVTTESLLESGCSLSHDLQRMAAMAPV